MGVDEAGGWMGKGSSMEYWGSVGGVSMMGWGREGNSMGLCKLNRISTITNQKKVSMFFSLSGNLRTKG